MFDLQFTHATIGLCPTLPSNNSVPKSTNEPKVYPSITYSRNFSKLDKNIHEVVVIKETYPLSLHKSLKECLNITIERSVFTSG